MDSGVIDDVESATHSESDVTQPNVELPVAVRDWQAVDRLSFDTDLSGVVDRFQPQLAPVSAFRRRWRTLNRRKILSAESLK